MICPKAIQVSAEAIIIWRAARSVFVGQRWIVHGSTTTKVAAYSPSCPASSGASSTPRPFRWNAKASGILGRPVKPGDDTVVCDES